MNAAIWKTMFVVPMLLPFNLATAREIVAKHDGSVSYVSSLKDCQEKVELIIEAGSQDFYRGDRIKLQKLIGISRIGIEFGCPATETLNIVGMFNEKKVFRGRAKRESNWALEIVSQIDDETTRPPKATHGLDGTTKTVPRDYYLTGGMTYLRKNWPVVGYDTKLKVERTADNLRFISGGNSYTGADVVSTLSYAKEKRINELREVNYFRDDNGNFYVFVMTAGHINIYQASKSELNSLQSELDRVMDEYGPRAMSDHHEVMKPIYRRYPFFDGFTLITGTQDAWMPLAFLENKAKPYHKNFE